MLIKYKIQKTEVRGGRPEVRGWTVGCQKPGEPKTNGYTLLPFVVLPFLVPCPLCLSRCLVALLPCCLVALLPCAFSCCLVAFLPRCLFLSVNIVLTIKRMTILFNVFRRIHAEQFIKLGPEVLDITDANFKRGLVHIIIAFKHQFRRFP
jgi:hypothetical protein